MTKQEFLHQLEEVIEADSGTLQGDESLGDVEGWDSLAVMGFIAMVDEQFGVTLAPDKLGQAKTVNDLVALVGDKIEG